MFENNTWDFWRGAEKLASNKIKSVSSAVDNVTGCDRVTSLLIYSRKWIWWIISLIVCCFISWEEDKKTSKDVEDKLHKMQSVQGNILVLLLMEMI